MEPSEFLRAVIGCEIWSATAGPKGRDYVLSLELGEKVRRSARLANPRFSFLKRTFEGTYSFLIECPWRIDGPSEVLLSCYEFLDLPGAAPMASTAGGGAAVAPVGGAQEIDLLVGRRVERIDLGTPGGDLAIGLSDGSTLSAFALEIPSKAGRQNWSYWSPDGFLVLRPGHRLERQSRDAAIEEASRLAHRFEQDDLELSTFRHLVERTDLERPEDPS